MNGATLIAISTALFGGFFPMMVAMRSPQGAAVNRDTVAWIAGGTLILLMLLNVTAFALVASSGMAYIGLAKAALLLIAAFAVVCMVIGLVRGLRSGKAIKTRSA